MFADPDTGLSGSVRTVVDMTNSWAVSAADPQERAVLLSFLETQQSALRRKLEGITDHEARQPRVPSGTSLAGLLKHVTYVHARWFELCFADAVPDGRLPWPTEDHVPGADEPLDLLLARYDKTIGIARNIIEGASLTDLNHGWHGGGYEPATFTLRWIVLHMIEEVARHCGHADILREQLDGSTGYP